jgi:hypothetical protein
MGRPFAKPADLPSQERLNQLFRYDRETGKLFWKERPLEDFRDTGKRSAEWMSNHYHSRFAGKEAGSAHHDGYVRCMLEGKHHMVHRIIWKMVYGHDPVQIDHIDGDRSHNRLENFRDVSHQVNAKNRKLYESNTSGIPGVSFHERDGVWQARINVGEGKTLQLGSFSLKSEAIIARTTAELVLGYHTNHGKSRS